MHTRDALKAGESQQRIFLLNAWRETNIFSEKEKAVLALTVGTFRKQNNFCFFLIIKYK